MAIASTLGFTATITAAVPMEDAKKIAEICLEEPTTKSDFVRRAIRHEIATWEKENHKLENK